MHPKSLVVDRRSDVPLYRQLEGALRDAILNGRLEPGERVLSSRELQTHLGLSRNTIVTALAQLESEGYLVTVRGAGTFVSEALFGRTAMHLPAERERSLTPTEAAASFLSSSALAANMRGMVPFRPGIPALDLFPLAQFKRTFSARDWLPAELDYPPALGHERLREAIVKRLQQTRGIACSMEDVIVTGGAQAAFSLVARVLLKKGDTVAVEDPGYPGARAIFVAQQARVTAIPVDDAGLETHRLAKRNARLVHVTPSHQYPTGAVLSLERRLELLEWARKNRAWIVEDDYDSEFNYTGRAQPAMYGLDATQVVYVGTFSKVLAPALRIAYIVIPSALRAWFEAALQVTGAQPSIVVQAALANFIEAGHFARHIRKMRSIYDERRRYVGAEIARAFGSEARIHDTRAGLHFVVSLPQGVSDAKFSSRAAQRGVVVPPLSSYFHGKPRGNGLVIGYAGSAIPAAKRAISILKQLL
jgi:GntR family transcriptional regulator/MocR family aminotransferase